MDIDGIQSARQRAVQRSTDGIIPPVFPRTVAPDLQRTSVVSAGQTPMSTPAPIPMARPAKQPSEARRDAQQFDVPERQVSAKPKRAARKRWSVFKKRWSVRRTVWTSLVTLVVLVLGVGGFLSWRAYANLHKVFRGTSTSATALTKRVIVPNDLKAEGAARINILLLGIGGPGHQGPDLTDTIVILSVDPVNGSAIMLSVPRDLWVKQPVNYFGTEQKINAAYESGKYHTTGKLDPTNTNSAAIEAGFDSIDTVIKTVFNVPIQYHVLVNFQAFRQAIDTVGGITVNVPTQLYDPTMAWENHWNPVLAPAGVQQMDGVKALLYARSRETTSDFARSQRQRQILLALKDKVLDLGTLSNPAKIEGLMNAFGNNVYADLSTSEATHLYGIMKNIDDAKVGSIGLTDEPHKLVQTAPVNNTSAVRPVAGFFQYSDIQGYVRSQLPDGYLVKEKAPITVAAPTLAIATTTSDLLKSYGYNVTTPVVTTHPITDPVIVDLSKGKAPYTLHYLQARFGIKRVRELPPDVVIPQASAKFVIMVSK